jgi:DinB superfamily
MLSDVWEQSVSVRGTAVKKNVHHDKLMTGHIDPAAIELIARTPRVLRALLSGLPAVVLTTSNAEGWSVKDIVAHLHDVEGVAFVERISRMLSEDQPFIQSIDPPARLDAGGYTLRGLQELLDDLERQRAEHLAWLAALTPEQLARSGQHDAEGDIYVVDIAHQWAAHDMAHLRQVSLMLQEYLAPLMGRTRGFYDV